MCQLKVFLNSILFDGGEKLIARWCMGGSGALPRETVGKNIETQGSLGISERGEYCLV